MAKKSKVVTLPVGLPPQAPAFVSKLHADQYWKIRTRMEQLTRLRIEASKIAQTVDHALDALREEMTKVGLDPTLTYTFDDNALTFSR